MHPLDAWFRSLLRFTTVLCEWAGIMTSRQRTDGVTEHLDVHSFRRTFTIDLIENGADPKSVQ